MLLRHYRKTLFYLIRYFYSRKSNPGHAYDGCRSYRELATCVLLR
ncbi:hypothetical protein ANAPC1_00774 [Anaplasma phagocytophilum]|uniref:Uncharacterized protein n=1 Tax=Anaplasma phagocytophilum TaxID=948 RepID=A0AA45UTI9_ANAPH|nr:hypothetical protein ANAPC1_00774 [Anaplasma phagocytophilum]SBO30081.1 hypothetical protein ANAPC2_00106 [Anaplasma phagocytophilum]SBO32032.1 hypothetical protein ANAPC3_00726 [Anaplasma phagocytophilum]SBO32168.1 hypothetical protein ANAPC4_00720 [Anaplasma phagocytophilum]SCV63680.1 hypothetical protein ANAPC5_00643 [Anaplasma phagocytophilum]